MSDIKRTIKKGPGGAKRDRRFNTPNLESLIAVLNAAEKLKVPVIIMHAQLHEVMTPLAVIGPVMLQMAQKSPVPVCVHLDHGETPGYLRQALELGFTSVMYDGSALGYEENVAATRRRGNGGENRGLGGGGNRRDREPRNDPGRRG